MSVSAELQTMEPGFTWDQAVAEADRCLLCHDAPCSKGCPAGTDPATFICQLRLRNVTGAIRTIRQNNVLGGACGVLCPTARLCEKECSACDLDHPIRIGRLQRFLIEHAWKIEFNVFDNPRYQKPEPRPERVAAIGAGPAGLSCASELAQNGYAVTVFEQREEPGGVLRYGVPSFRFDPAFLRRELDDLKPLGVEIRCMSPLSAFEQLDDLLKEYKSVFVVVGLWKSIPLIEGKRPRSGVFSSIDFLERFRRGDLDALAAECRGKTVAVVGGGSVAIDCAQVASRLGAGDVYLVYRRSYAQMPAEKDERLAALEQGIHFLVLNQPIEYLENSQGGLSGLRLRRTRLGEPDASGRRKPLDIEGSEWILEAQTVVEAIGNQAPDELRIWAGRVERTSRHLIQADPQTARTSRPGVFAGGDIVRGPATVVEAIADGKKAAHAIMQYLQH